MPYHVPVLPDDDAHQGKRDPGPNALQPKIEKHTLFSH
jgi:hypothetical protein